MVDFIDVGLGVWRWPVFNVADSAVSIGVVLFALTWSQRQPGRHVAPTGAAAAGRDGNKEHDRVLDLSVPSPTPGSGWPASCRGADGPVA